MAPQGQHEGFTFTYLGYDGSDLGLSDYQQTWDLQRSVHEDMRAHFAEYPQKWGLRGPDRNIDHRRVPNLQTWFARQGWSRTYNFGSEANARLRWQAAREARVDFIATDQYEAFSRR